MALAALAAFIWSGNFIVARAVIREISPVSLTFLRCTTALIVLLPICLPCIKELPALNKLVEEYRNNKDVVFLSLTWETKERVEKEFFAKYKLDFEVIPEEMKALELYGKPGFPTTFVIGKDGKVKAAFLGGPIEYTIHFYHRKRKPGLNLLLVDYFLITSLFYYPVNLISVFYQSF